jgi:hypothetical protein
MPKKAKVAKEKFRRFTASDGGYNLDFEVIPVVGQECQH